MNSKEVTLARRAEKSRLFSLVVLTWYRLVLVGAQVLSMVRKIRFQDGNKKLSADDKIAFVIWSLPAVLTCPGATVQCMRNCYARRDERFISVRSSRIINLILSRRDDFEELLTAAIRDKIYTRKGEMRKRYQGKEIVFRLHESGDFYSDRYMKIWFRVAAKFPEITFFTYTKSFRMYERNMSMKPDNFTVRASIWSDTTPEEIATIARCKMPIYTAYVSEEMQDAIRAGVHECTCESCTKCGCACARREHETIGTRIH